MSDTPKEPDYHKVIKNALLTGLAVFGVFKVGNFLLKKVKERDDDFE